MMNLKSTGTTPAQYSKWLVLAVLSAALFMINLDVTIVNIALPDIMERLPASLADAEWVLNAYVLVFAILLITMGRLGDIFGRKRLFTGGLLVFTVSSLLCGLAPNIGWLIAGRIAQAAGGAAMMPATLSILNITFQSGQRGLAMGIWGASAGAAAALGPIIGGLLVGTLGWQWVFLINIPLGIAALVAAFKIVPESCDPNATRRIDFPGIIAATIALGAISFALIEGQALGWTSVVTLGLFGAGIIAAAAFLVIEAKARTPLIPLVFFRNISFTAGNILGLIVMFCLVGLIFLSVMYLQAIRDFSPMDAGLVVLPLSLALMIISPVAGRLADRLQMRFLMSAGMVMVALAFSLLAQINPEVPAAMMAWPLGLAGLGLGLVMAPLSSVVMASAPLARSGTASGILTTMRQVGATLGITVLGAVLQFNMVNNLRIFFEGIPFMPQTAKDAILKGVSEGGMAGAVTSDAPEFLKTLISQVMTEQFSLALSSAMTVAMWVCIAGAAAALFINYHPRRTTTAAA
ncbi:MAG: DHA2 family efflux MFS transporter permease subunit [Dehalogenimonas sp.]|uniref:DHA2 family efflux MFS transporter permease subunit n=1 Tax=Candidatus Dehalogenimonas loeffleri TaxID=3127115 RepID=A0ABZ2J1R7_9CHLR|nr:DHA2 family efflux MFS transporter permease subunit [Dehalogenimonas sp.]